ncbi:unnamed protein product, partial [Polarella glacialis]
QRPQQRPNQYEERRVCAPAEPWAPRTCSISPRSFSSRSRIQVFQQAARSDPSKSESFGATPVFQPVAWSGPSKSQSFGATARHQSPCLPSRSLPPAPLWRWGGEAKPWFAADPEFNPVPSRSRSPGVAARSLRG